MSEEFLYATLGRTGRRVFRLGMSASFFPGEQTVEAALDAGVNYLFWYGWDWHMTRVLRRLLPARREQLVLATGAGNLGRWALRRAVDWCRRRVNTDYIDVFHCLWVGDGNLDARTRELLETLKQEGKIRHVAISTHARRYGGQLVRDGLLDVLMMRYNAAHRGAEQDIFPNVQVSQPGLVAYTATRWGKLLRAPRGWPETGRVPDAGDCYRFVLSNPNVHVCLTAPSSRQQLEQNLSALARGPMSQEELEFMRRFGDAVRAKNRWFV